MVKLQLNASEITSESVSQSVTGQGLHSQGCSFCLMSNRFNVTECEHKLILPPDCHSLCCPKMNV
jgi:hypothetical protein